MAIKAAKVLAVDWDEEDPTGMAYVLHAADTYGDKRQQYGDKVYDIDPGLLEYYFR